MDIDQKTRRKKLVLTGLLVILLGILFLYSVRGFLYSELEHWGFIPMPEHFTELYFDNASSLPKQTVANQLVSFSFVIHNVEGETMAYPYTVSFQSLFGNQIILATGTVSLADGAATTTNILYTFPQSNLQGTVVVDLTSLDQQIDFIVPDTN